MKFPKNAITLEDAEQAAVPFCQKRLSTAPRMLQARRIPTVSHTVDGVYQIRIRAMLPKPANSPVWKPVRKRPACCTSMVMRPNSKPAPRETPALPAVGRRLSTVQILNTTKEPKRKPVRNITALKQRYPGCNSGSSTERN